MHVIELHQCTKQFLMFLFILRIIDFWAGFVEPVIFMAETQHAWFWYTGDLQLAENINNFNHALLA